MNPKQANGQITRTLEAWQELRAKKSYADMSLEDFKKKIQPSVDARKEIDTLRVQLKDALVRRDTADRAACTACIEVARAVVGDKAEGPNSPFYKALGYVTHAERKSGLARKRSNVIKAA